MSFRVAQEPNRNRKPEPSEPFFPKPKANRNRRNRFPGPETGTGTVLSCQTVLKYRKNPFRRGTAGTENRNLLNRPMHEP